MPPPVHEVDDPPVGDGERAAPKVSVGQWAPPSLRLPESMPPPTAESIAPVLVVTSLMMVAMIGSYVLFWCEMALGPAWLTHLLCMGDEPHERLVDSPQRSLPSRGPRANGREQTPTTTPCGGARHSQVDLRSEVNELREALRAARRQLEHYGV